MIIIFGATGFIGMYTAEAFVKAGKKVIATGRNEKLGKKLTELGAEFIKMDITCKEDFEKLPKKDVEGVVLLAGLLPANAKVDLDIDENAADYFKVNVLGSINVLEYCRKNGIRKVIGNCSYSDVSGAWGKGFPITEEEPRNFKMSGDHAVYVISRNACNDVMEYYNQQHGMQCAWFRFPPVYGVGPHGTIYVNGKPYKSGIATFIDNAKEGRDIELWGDPHIKRDIVYVKDVARAYVMAMSSDRTYGLYNMTSSTQLDLEDQAKAVIKVFGNPEKPSRIVYRPEKPNNTPSFLYSMEKAKRDFGFVPEYTDYYAMMLDYKQELESGRWDLMMESRKKTDKKDIVILGASYLQMPLIEKAKELGYTTHVFAWECGDVGEKAADHFYPVSIMERDRIVEICREIKPDAICTISTDLGAVTANYVANALGLPANPPESMIPASNKYVMRRALRDAGISVPAFVRIRQSESASAAEGLEYPVIVKPTDRSGSRGVSKIESPAGLEKALESAWSSSFEKTAIAEEYLDGDEYSCESASFRGVHHIIAFTKKYTTGAPSFIETGHIQPSDLSAEQTEKAAAEIVRALDALHITDGISHSEFKVNSRGEIKIIEIGARMGGDFIGSHLVQLSTGVDFVKAALDIALGREPCLEKRAVPMAAGVRFVMGREDVEYIRRLGQSRPELIYEKGVFFDELDDAVTDSSTRHGYVILTGENAGEIREALELG